MSAYSKHFVICLSLSIIVTYVILFLRSQKKSFALVVPVIFFIFFYNYDYSLLPGVPPILICYAGAVYSSLLVLFFASIEETCLQRIKINCVLFKVFLFAFVQFVCIFICQCFPWAIDTFPLSNVDTVLFTVFAGENEGAEEFVWSSFFKRVPLYAVLYFAVLLAVQMALAYYLSKRSLSIKFHLWRMKYNVIACDFKVTLLQIVKPVTLIVFVYFSILSVLLPGIFLSSAFEALTQKSVDSELYRFHYVYPDSVKIVSPERPKNLIVVFLESMETNFAKYTPEIVTLEKSHISFPPGGVSVAGTGWTIAGITAKLCGIPLNMPMGVNEYLGELPTYLPKARCLMDLLEKEQYNQDFIQGSNGDFTQIRKFVDVHGHLKIHDSKYYKEKGKIPSDYYVFWEIEDRKLYQYAKDELDSLYKLGRPFALFLTTLDTHQPNGYADEICNRDFGDVKDVYPRALRCASKQLYDFILWTKNQPWSKNTVISVMGDHTMPMLSVKANVPHDDSLYWTNFVINSTVEVPMKERLYSSLDMFPTLMESMGFKIEGRRLGLGSSLYSDSLTMLELYGRRTLDSLLRERSIQYDYFLFGN